MNVLYFPSTSLEYLRLPVNADADPSATQAFLIFQRYTDAEKSTLDPEGLYPDISIAAQWEVLGEAAQVQEGDNGGIIVPGSYDLVENQPVYFLRVLVGLGAGTKGGVELPRGSYNILVKSIEGDESPARNVGTMNVF